MTGGIWVEGSTWGRGGPPESQERRTRFAIFLDPKGKNQISLSSLKWSPQNQTLLPSVPQNWPQEQGSDPLHFLQGLRTGSVCPQAYPEFPP